MESYVDDMSVQLGSQSPLRGRRDLIPQGQTLGDVHRDYRELRDSLISHTNQSQRLLASHPESDLGDEDYLDPHSFPPVVRLPVHLREEAANKAVGERAAPAVKAHDVPAGGAEPKATPRRGRLPKAKAGTKLMEAARLKDKSPDLTNEQIAALVGVCPQTIGRWFAKHKINDVIADDRKPSYNVDGKKGQVLTDTDIRSDIEGWDDNEGY